MSKGIKGWAGLGLLLCALLFMLAATTAQVTETDPPKGFVDPVKELKMRVEEDDDIREFWRRTEELYLVPFEISIVLFDSITAESDDARLAHPISGAPLIIKRGEVIPSYQIDLDYGPLPRRDGGGAQLEGVYIMKNIQFGNTTFNGLLYNVGGYVNIYSWFAGGDPAADPGLLYNFSESISYGSQNRLPEASYAGSARIHEYAPDTLTITTEAGQYSRSEGTGEWNTHVLDLRFRVVGAKLAPAGVDLFAGDEKQEQVVETEADRERGETGVPLAGALAAVIIGGVVAAAAAGLGSGGDDGEGTKKSSYQMRLQKDFGDTIRYDQAPVPLYARMVEITAAGEEIDRPDLTANLTIFSTENLIVGEAALAGNYMGAHLSARLVKGAARADRGVVSIRFTGEGGTFQNNVTFRLMEEGYISLDKPHLPVLVGSGEKFRLPVQFVDFEHVPSAVAFDGEPLPIELESDEAGHCFIAVTDDTPRPERITTFYEEIPYTISARDGEETVEARFSVLKCYEGLLIDFLGGENEMVAYKDQEGKMHITEIGFQLGLFNRERGELELVAPPELTFAFADAEGIFDLIGFFYEPYPSGTTSEMAVYSFNTKKSLPSMETVSGTIAYRTEVGGVGFENQSSITLIPDAISYDEDWAREYQNCLKIIKTYMPEPLKSKKIAELESNKDRLGLQDLHLFRKTCWVIARNMIFQEKEDYLQISYWEEQKISNAETVAHIGDMAFTAAAASVGGPVTIFLLENVKDTLLDLVEQYQLKGSVFTWETLETLANNRFKQALGSVTDFIQPDRKPSPKVILAWLAYFYTYRVFYRWYYDQDLEGVRLGLSSAMQKSIRDVFDYAAVEVLKGIMRNQFKAEATEKLKDKVLKEEKWVKDIAGKGLDAADKVAEGLDTAVERGMEMIMDGIKNLGSLLGAS